MDDWLTQPECSVTFGWGHEGLLTLGPTCDVVVIVDVLRFTSCVSVACARGAAILPFEWNDERVGAYAAERGALVAGMREDTHQPWSLSPTDLLQIPAGTRLVLPSPNGSALSFRGAELGADVVAGSLRNARAVGAWLAARIEEGERVAVIASGERYSAERFQSATDSLRPAVEDLYGAGAVIDRIVQARAAEPKLSPEAWSACAAFRDAEPTMHDRLIDAASGRELLERGWRDDVETCALLDADDCVPQLSNRTYVRL